MSMSGRAYSVAWFPPAPALQLDGHEETLADGKRHEHDDLMVMVS